MDPLEISATPTSWYKDAVIYEAHVRTFFDSNGDGIGDFSGLTQKLGYLADLGITALWLLPFYPSPLRDGGYDISDYLSIDPVYGTMKDWRAFLSEAHQRGLRVITELVINHTSDQHPWFQRARRDGPGNRWREYYVWTDNPDQYRQARIIFKDSELSNWSWDPVMKKVGERLVTPFGLRTLSPDNPEYKSRYFGDLRARDAACHQGTGWAWLIGPYIDALLKAHPMRRGEAEELLRGMG